ncbi:uncharacterized protein LOC144477164 [Augochlora pura]
MGSKDAMEAEKRMEVQASEFGAVKLPPFWKEEPRLWFTVLEREFAAYNIKADVVKSSAVTRSLDSETLKVVVDVVEAPPEKSTYGHIKQALIERLAKSDEVPPKQLFSDVDLGHRKPSEILREMVRMAGAKVTENELKTLWMQWLPARVQDILSVVDDASVERLAKIADKTMDRATGADVVAIAPPRTRFCEQDGALAAIINRLDRLEMRLSRRDRQRSPSGQRHNHRGNQQQRRARNRSRSTTANGFCYFHNKFGKESWKCRKPCRWTEALGKQQKN